MKTIPVLTTEQQQVIASIPEYILHKLRKRRGLTQEDASEDDEIAEMTVYERFTNVVAWELGYAQNAPHILNMVHDSGIKMIDPQDRLAWFEQERNEVLDIDQAIAHLQAMKAEGVERLVMLVQAKD